jgi:hypothetical protein
MSTTLIDFKNVVQNELNVSSESAEKFANTWAEYQKDNESIATKADIAELRGDIKLLKWMTGVIYAVIILDTLISWFA